MKHLLIILMTISLFRCGRNIEAPVLARAARIHQEVSMLASQLQQTLQTDSIHHPDSVKQWIEMLNELKSSIVEVSGDHEHAHHHNHRHEAVDLTPEQLLAAQMDISKQLTELETRIKRSSL